MSQAFKYCVRSPLLFRRHADPFEHSAQCTKEVWLTPLQSLVSSPSATITGCQLRFPLFLRFTITRREMSPPIHCNGRLISRRLSPLTRARERLGLEYARRRPDPWRRRLQPARHKGEFKMDKVQVYGIMLLGHSVVE